MGGSHSFPLPRYSCCIRPESPHRCRENHARVSSSRKRRPRSSQSDLVSSAPNNASCVEFGRDPTTYGLLDINAATAEELMTLPGINRATATNIVYHRRQIGFFRRIEDVVIVPGMGATRFGHVRAEICVGDLEAYVGRSSLVRGGSSATSSGIDVSVTPADNVSREYYGGDDGVGLTFSGRTFCPETVTNGYSKFSYGKLPTANDSAQITGTGKHLAADELDDVTAGLLRHSVGTSSTVSSKGSGCLDRSELGPLRVASWNILPCSLEKVENSDFREVFSRTIFENSLSIVAVRGTTDPIVLQKLCDELNTPVEPSVMRSSGRRGSWKFVSSPSSTEDTNENKSYGGVLYDVTQGVELLTNVCLSSELFICTFRTPQCDQLRLVVWCGRSFNDILSPNTTVDAIAELVQDAAAVVVLVGDFGLSADEPEMACLRKLKFSAALRSDDQSSEVRSSNVSGTKCFENIWTSTEASNHCRTAHVVRNMPTDDTCDHPPSSLCPVWAEFVWKPRSRECLVA